MPRPTWPVFRLASLVLIVAAAWSAAAYAEDTIRLGRDVEPRQQFVSLDIDPARANYSGSVRIALQVNTAVRSFRFHAEDMDIRSVRLSGPGSRGNPGPTVELRHRADDTGTVTASASRQIAAGRYTLDIDFANEFGTRAVGLYRMDSGPESFVFTQFEAVDARKAFPCWDEPSFKIPYQLTVTVPFRQVAVSNTPIARRDTTYTRNAPPVGRQPGPDAEGRETIHFERTPPLPSYLLAIAVGNLESVEIPGMRVPGRIYTTPGKTALAAEATRMAAPLLTAVEEYFGREYPFKKLDFIAVPEYWPGAMEHPGAITFAEPILLLDPDQITFRERRRLANVIAHEIAHMWFGNLVTMEWWDDLWLNESFAYWMAAKIVDQVYPTLRYAVNSVRNAQQAMRSDALATARPIRQPIDDLPNILRSSNVLTNHKGHAVLGMFERWIGPELFQRGVRNYINDHEWGNAQANDLWLALSLVSERRENIGVAMATYLDQPGVPVVYIEVIEEGDQKGHLRMIQQRFMPYGVDDPNPDQLWQIPVVMRVATTDGRVEQVKVWLTQREQIVELRQVSKTVEVDWIYPNSLEMGYYRWHVDQAMLEKLSGLISRRFIVRERVALISHVGAMLDAGVITGDRFLAAMQRFAEDPVPDVIHTVMDGLARVESAFISTDLEGQFARYVRWTMGHVLEGYGMQKAHGEEELVTALRPTLLAWIGDKGLDPDVLLFAEQKAREYVEKGSLSDPSIAGVVLQLSAIRGRRELFDLYRDQFENATVPNVRLQYLSALGAFRDPDLVDLALDYILTGPLRPQELGVIYRQVGTYPPNEDMMFDWVMLHYDELVERMPPMNVPYLPWAAAGCSMERLATAQRFFGQPGHDPAGTSIELAKVTEVVTTCDALREREGAAVAKYLRELKQD